MDAYGPDADDTVIIQDSLITTLTKRLEKGLNETITLKDETISVQRKTIEQQKRLERWLNETITLEMKPLLPKGKLSNNRTV